MLGDGIILSDGVVLGDGILIGDSGPIWALSEKINGDDGTEMSSIQEDGSEQ